MQKSTEDISGKYQALLIHLYAFPVSFVLTAGRSTVQVTSDPMNLLGLLGSLLLNDGKNPVLERAPVFFSHLVWDYESD